MLKPFILPYLPNDKKIIIIGSFADRGIILNDLVKMGNDLGATTVIFPNICHAMMLDPDWIIVAETILGVIQNKKQEVEYVKEKMIRSQVWIKKVVEIVHVEM